jgi:PAS domain S-box-containing protein
MSDRKPDDLRKENAELRQRLADAEETLRAITNGEVDALVVNTKPGERVFTLQGADTVYRVAIENINEGVITLSPDGTILYSNHYFAQMVHADLSKVIGASILDFVNPESRDMFAALLSQESGRSGVMLCSGEGIQVPTFIATKRMKLDDVFSICAVATDLTQQKRSQETIAALREAEMIKDEFIGLVSHELRTPLTVIIGALATASDKRASNEDKEELINEASSSAESLAAILDNMLELSRSQAGRLKLDVKSVDIGYIAGKAVERVRRKYDTHRCIPDFPDDIPDVKVDPSRLEQVLYNLLENAVKYSPAGSDIRIFSRKEEEGLIIGVNDRGIGIAPEDQQMIFTPFSRLEGSGAKGIGLGLVVCKHLVEAHGGRIWVESQKGKGATFLFSIPFGTTND